MTTAQQPTTARIESLEIGRRYVATIAPKFNDGWKVASVEQRDSDLQVMRDGEWVAPTLVTVTYNNGRSITAELGTEIAIDCRI